MKAMILAAGLGTRLRPFTLDTPKPLIPVMNRPIIERLLRILYNAGVREVVVNTHHLSENIEKKVKSFFGCDMKIIFSYESELLGSAGGLKKVEDFFKGETFILINSDIYFNFDLDEGIKFHKQAGAAATLILKENENIDKYGLVGTDRDGCICSFPHGLSPGKPEKVGIFCGIHILEPEVFDFISPDQFLCINRNIYPSMIHSGKKICGCFVKGYWKDLGTPGDYFQVHWDILSRKTNIPEFSAFDGKIYHGSNSRIDENVRLIPPVWVGEKSVIKNGGCIGPFVVLGEENILEEDVVISRSILWNKAFLKRGVNVQNAVLSSNKFYII